MSIPMGRMKSTRAALAAVVFYAASLVAPHLVSAHYQDWPPTTFNRLLVCCYTTRTPDDTYRTRVASLTWNTTDALALRHMVLNHENFYTHDARDNSNN